MSVSQTYPDIFEKPTMYPSQRRVSNDRYKSLGFNQIHFTAGDPDQFETFQIYESASNIPSQVSDKEEAQVWNFTERKDISFDSQIRMDTFYYIFNKFKKGILIQIRAGKLVRFLPFSNAHFINDWHDRVKMPLPQELQSTTRILPVHRWYANNYLVRYENPLAEGDTGHAAIKDMFEELCRLYKVPDVDFFVNRRDFPILKLNRTEPYEAIFGDQYPANGAPGVFHTPILSMVEKEGFADWAIPTPEDWSRVRSLQNPPRYFMSTKRTAMSTEERDKVCLSWSMKKEQAVFRGSSTGKGIGLDNTRIRLCEFAKGHEFIDAAITSYSDRYQLVDGALLKQTKQQCGRFLTPEQQSRYKYIIHVSGHVRGFRLSRELSYQSVILLVGDEYRLWFEKKLEPMTHYVPVKADLSDLDEKILWCRNNDAACREIAQNARAFYVKYLSKAGCLTYLHEMLISLAKSNTPSGMSPFIPERTQVFCKAEETLRYIQLNPITCFKVASPVISETRCILNIVNARRQTKPGLICSNNRTRIEMTDEGTLIKRKKGAESAGLVHEYVMGALIVNDMLREIPNFAYTFDYLPRDNSLVVEYIPGKTLSDYVRSREFIFNEWLCMLKTLSLVFAAAHQKYKFVHNDACPWNIQLYEECSDVCYDYLCSGGRIVRVKSRRIPILMDFERSRTNVDQSFSDCICLLISSANEVINFQRLTDVQKETLTKIFNQVLSGCKEYYEGAKNFYGLTTFLREAHPFAHITFSKKGNIPFKDPLVLYDAICADSRVWSFEEVKSLEYNHMGKLSCIYSAPTVKGALFRLYMLQQLWIMTKGGPSERRLSEMAQSMIEPIDEADYYLSNICFQDTTQSIGKTGERQFITRCKVKNILEGILACGGPYKLTPEETVAVKALHSKLIATE